MLLAGLINLTKCLICWSKSSSSYMCMIPCSKYVLSIKNTVTQFQNKNQRAYDSDDYFQDVKNVRHKVVNSSSTVILITCYWYITQGIQKDPKSRINCLTNENKYISFRVFFIWPRKWVFVNQKMSIRRAEDQAVKETQKSCIENPIELHFILKVLIT